jgi:hypothetical protein
MTKSARQFLRTKKLDHTEIADKDVKKEFKPTELKSHDRPYDEPIRARTEDTVAHRGLTEE